jgi:Zn-dependent protease with chaperone function
MKKTVWTILALIVFLIFSVATLKIDKGNFNPNDLPPEITSVLSPDKLEQAVVLSDFRNGSYFFSTVFDILVLAGILWFGFSRRMKSAAEKLADKLHSLSSPMLFAALTALVVGLMITFTTATDKQLVSGGGIAFAVLWGVIGLFAGKSRNYAVKVLYILIFLGVLSLIDWPLAYYRDFVVEHHFGLSTQSFGAWLADNIKSTYIGGLFMVVLLPFAYWGITKRAKDWWLWIGVTAIPIMVFMMLVFPVFIAPMFNKFEPLKDEALSQRILGMADQAGISGARVYQVDMSTQTEKINAYVTGLFGSKRIVLWDTTIKKMTPDEIEFVMAHEMGHYVMNHIWMGLGLFSVIFLILLFIIYKSIGWFVGRYGERFGFAAVADIASLPLVMLMFSLLMFFAEPMMNTFSRTIEHSSDRFALNLTKDGPTAAKAFVKLANENLSNPCPSGFIEFWLYNHPALGKRIEFCKSYTPGSS